MGLELLTLLQIQDTIFWDVFGLHWTLDLMRNSDFNSLIA